MRAASALLFVSAVTGFVSSGGFVPESIARGEPGARPLATGWLSWRGPEQSGASRETGLPSAGPKGPLVPAWTVDVAGRGTPVVANGRVYAVGYRGDGEALRELVIAVDARSGARLWEHAEADFLSDTIYNRYAIGAPTVDAETGQVYALTANGLLSALSVDGKLLWQRSLMEEFGRLTFPNGRTGAPVLDGDLVIVRGITANWGAQGIARDRLYAFDKRSGATVWASTPGDQPRDNSFSTPVLEWAGGRRVLYVGLGCGNVAAVNARNGAPLWRLPIANGGVNASVLVDGSRLIAVHGSENLDGSSTGRMVALDLDKAWKQAAASPTEGPAVLTPTVEAWRNEVSSFSSSPVLHAGRVYQVSDTGDLVAVSAASGKILWRHKLGRDQIHASPLVADGKLYVPMNDGTLHVLALSDHGAKELSVTQLEGNCLGAPAVANGQIFVHTTTRLYAFGAPRADSATLAPSKTPAEPPRPSAGPAVQLAASPSEVLLRPGERAAVRVRKVDAAGVDVGDAGVVTWKSWIPPTAKVKSTMDAAFDHGVLVAGPSAKQSAGAFMATLEQPGGAPLTGTIRGRVVAGLPYAENFDSYPITEPHPTEANVKFGYPPLSWLGARVAWEVRSLDGDNVLAKTLDRILLQRAQTFIGHPEMRDYTMAADVMSEGNKRLMSDVGVINQRYLVALKGTWQQIEISSNQERLKVAAPFAWKPSTWYRIALRVEPLADGTTRVRAKAWPRGQPEPAAWTVEVAHQHGHTHGSPGLFGFAPQSKFRVYVDNVSIVPNSPLSPTAGPRVTE